MQDDNAASRAIWLGILVACVLISACGRPSPATRAERTENASEPAQREPDEVSDLDRPIEDLFAATCAHGLKTFECDDCRYEIGVVRVPQDLIEEGLIRVAEAQVQPVRASLMLTGEVQFDERRVAHLAPRTDGVLRVVHVQIGDRVTAGRPLLEVDSTAMDDARGEYLEARAARELAARTLERLKALRREGVASEREVLEAENAHLSADLRLRVASERLLRLGLTPTELKSLRNGGRPGDARGRLVVRAPADGRVMDLHAVVGEAVKAGEPVITIGETDLVRVFADVYEDHLGVLQSRLAEGPIEAVVTVRAFPGEEFPGTLDLLGSVMERESRTVKARVTVANPDGRLRPWMFAQVRVWLPGAERALAVPRTAVMQDEGRTFVFVWHHADYFVRRPVQTGREWDGWVEVRGGIQAGQRVAADGAFLLKSDVLRSKMGAGCAD